MKYFKIAKDIDKDYYENYLIAKKSGVQFIAYKCKIDPKQIKIEKIKVVNHQFGSTYKMILLSDSGYKLYGSIPTKLLQDFDYNKSKLEGLQISFDATVEQSDSDRYFGFFKRPTKLNIYKESE